MNDQAVRFRLGIFFLSALILLAVLIMLFGGWARFFQRYNHYTVTFTNAAGVAPGTPVRRSGVRIGEVEAVELDNQSGLVRVPIKVAQEYTVRKSDQAAIAHGLLGGDTSIDFVSHTADGKAPDTSPLPPGSVIEGGGGGGEAGNLAKQGAELVPAARETLKEVRQSFEKFNKTIPLLEETLREFRDLGKVMGALVPELRRTSDEAQITARNWGKLGERLDVLLQTNDQKLTKTLDQLNDTLRRVSAVFNDENQKNLNETLKNVRDGSTRMDSITRNTDELLKESRKTMTQVNGSLARADEVLANMQQATKPLAERNPLIMRNLDESTQKLNQLMGDLRDFVRTFGRSDGTLQRLLNDASLYNHLDEALCLVTRSLPRMDRILSDLEIFADKLARHPEAIGLGGVVRPSSGLKDAPPSSSWKMPPGH
jgi:phospholipid/cholesterol/gamma-HCH transport system substrate-binding protein